MSALLKRTEYIKKYYNPYYEVIGEENEVLSSPIMSYSKALQVKNKLEINNPFYTNKLKIIEVKDGIKKEE